MLLPHEYQFLRDEEGRSRLHWVVVAAIAVVCALVPVVLALSSAGMPDHLAGRTEPAMAKVASIQEIGTCRSGTKHRIDISWTEDGAAQKGDYTKCGDVPKVGEIIEIWVGPDGQVHTTSPKGDWTGLVAIGVFLGVFAAGTGAAMVILRAKRRRRVLATGGLSPAPAGWVDVTVGAQHQVRIRAAAPTHDAGSAGSRAYAVVHSSPGATTKRHARNAMGGRWWLQLMPPDTAARRRTGLLTRGPERWWVDLPGH